MYAWISDCDKSGNSTLNTPVSWARQRLGAKREREREREREKERKRERERERKKKRECKKRLSITE